ncbi:stimulated by retinoic acid gene 6 protein-like, partial [Dendronephthya gigantea]|uniref:stimulated by retinoic acid gene 6 protein-like n=1 Tax=Dendronephthya gigantea TaxID=151771 RepID=UPI00106CF1B0
MNNITSDPTTTPCAVNRRYYPHMFLIPAVIIITILAFLRRRSSFKKQVWGGRPGLVIPIDFLGIDHDRLAIVFVFGAATGSIVDLILTKYEGRNIWETAFIGIGIALEVAFLYYPYFACLASYHRIIGALMGLPYASIMFALGKTMDLEECNGNTRTWQDVVFMYILPNILTIICHLCILGKFIIVLYQEIKEYGIFGIQIFDRRNEDLSMQVNLTRPWLINHVKDLIKRRTPQYSRTEYYLRKIYNPEKNFKFSTQTLSVVMICSILCYKISFILVLQASTLLDAINDDDSDHILVKLSRGFFGALLAGTILTAIFCVVSIIRFMENHKNNMLQMFKGDKSFIPRKINVTQFMIGKGLRYHSYQIGYFLWGYALLLSLFFLICF